MLSLFPKLPTPKLHLLRHKANSTINFRRSLRIIRNMKTESTQQQRMFQLKLDPLTGNSEWVVIEEESPSQPNLSTTSYLDMLNDTPRNKAYRQAIDNTITKPCHVLDIGAGTGLLSMMAARAMQSGNSGSKGTVTACESYLPMVKVMRKVLRANGMERNIRIINRRSDELEVGVDISSRAQVLVSEILDSEFFGEGLIPSLQHAHDKLLVENPLTVPYQATIFGQLVESTYLWKLHDLVNQESESLDNIKLIPKGMHTILSTKRQQYPMHCDAIIQEMKLLSEPFKVFDFDFWRRPESYEESEICVKAINHGTAHAIITWWVLQLDSEGTIFYSTAPKWIESPLPDAHHWCDHWKQCVWFIPEKGLSVLKNDEVHLHATHNEMSISYEVKNSPEKGLYGQYDLSTLFLSPERIGILGNSSWRGSMSQAIKNALQKKESPLCVVADDSIFLTIALASFSEKSHVISLFPGLREKGMKYLHKVSEANNFSMDRVETISKRNVELNMTDTHQRKIDILVAEPFYSGGESMLPWQNLRFWKERTLLDPILSQDVVIMPCKGILKACAMYLPDLWKSRRCLKEIEGFDHSVVNYTLGACGDLPIQEESACLAFPMWQCGEIKMLSDEITVMEFDLLKPIHSCSGNVQVEFNSSGICHGFALWIDWVMDVENSIVLSTGPDKKHWKQGVKLLKTPVMVGRHGSTNACYSVYIETSFDPLSGDLAIKHAFS